MTGPILGHMTKSWTERARGWLTCLPCAQTMSLRDPSTRELDSSTRANGRIHGDDIDEPLSSVPAPALATAPAAPPPPLDPKVDFIAGTVAGEALVDLVGVQRSQCDH